MDAQTLDHAVERAWPARERVRLAPWTARLDGGVTRRANSVLPHGTGPVPPDSTLDRLLEETVRLYGMRGLTPWIQVTGAAWPASLEAELEARGWETGIDRTLLLAGPLPPVEPCHDVLLAPSLDDGWLETWWEVDPRGNADALPVARAVIERIAEPVRFATVVAGGRRTGTALGVLVDGALVLECVATRPEARGRGVARAAVGALARWAGDAGAAGAVLAVLERNAPARRLYERLGLRPLGAYAYARPR